MEVSMPEAALYLGISVDTVRRRLHRGELNGHQEPTAQGFRWIIDIPDDTFTDPGNAPATATLRQNGSHPGATLDATLSQSGTTPASPGELEALREIIDVVKTEVVVLQEQLRTQLEAKDNQIQQLHVLLQQTQAMLPAPPEHRSWWHRLWGGVGRLPLGHGFPNRCP